MNLNSLNNFLNKNPKILSTYVNVSMTVVNAVLKPLNSVMKHALVIQGIDPAVQPGEKQRKALKEALDKEVSVVHAKDFDDDFDFSWVQKALGTVNKVKNLKLTPSNYKKLTDLSNVDDVKPPYDLHEVSIFPTEDEKVEAINKAESRPVTILEGRANLTEEEVFEETSDLFSKVVGISSPVFKAALNRLKDLAEELENVNSEEEKMIKQSELDEAGQELMAIKKQDASEKFQKAVEEVKKYNSYPNKIKPIRKYKKGSFQRVDKKKE